MGRSSKDNDRLSIDPAFRDSDDWWLHAGGVPGLGLGLGLGLTLTLT